MKMKIRFFLSALLLALLLPLSTRAQVTRQELAQIRVGRDGNFRYWADDSPALQALKEFVALVTDPARREYVPVEDRIATFDVDGTLLNETAPFYMNWMLCIYRYLHDPTYVPKDTAYLRVVQGYERSLLRHKHVEEHEGELNEQEYQAKAFRGMTQQEYSDYVSHFLDTQPVRGLTGLTWGTAFYWPMIEVVSYLVANDFSVYLCSGVDRDICRVLTRDIFEIPSYRMMTSDVHYVTASSARAGRWTEDSISEGVPFTPGDTLVRGDFRSLCTNVNKVTTMRRELGRKPILAWGNSSGDYPMFDYTTHSNPYHSIAFCLLCDDVERELGDTRKAEKCLKQCREKGRVAVSMRKEWRTIYGPGVQPMRDYRDVVFAEAPTASGGTKQLSIDIWRGAGQEPQPVVLFVHGGAWVSGTNDLDRPGSEQIQALMALRERGITVAAATYRFSSEATFPAQIHDVKAAIRYLKAHAATYGIDPTRIMTMGESAGAQLALLAAVTGGDKALEGTVGNDLEADSRVIGCVDCYGMTDFLTLAADLYARPDLGRTDQQVFELVEDKHSSRSQLFGLTCDDCSLGTVTAHPDRFPEQYALVKAGSPLHHVTPDDPPVLIINGQRDHRVPSAQAIRMYQALYDAGVETELILNDRAPHGNLGPEAAAAIQSFICRILLGASKTTQYSK